MKIIYAVLIKLILLNKLFVSGNKKVECLRSVQSSLDDISTLAISIIQNKSKFDDNILIKAIHSSVMVVNTCMDKEINPSKFEKCSVEIKHISPQIKVIIVAIINNELNLVIAEGVKLILNIKNLIPNCLN